MSCYVLFRKSVLLKELGCSFGNKLRHFNGCKYLLAKSEEEIFDALYPDKPQHIPFDEASYKREIGTLRKREYKVAVKKEEPKGVPIIKCKRREFNHYKNQTYDKFSVIPLASSGWGHRKSKGDYFTINIYPEKSERESIYWYSNNVSFSDLGLEKEMEESLEKMGINRPTKIQVDAIPVLLAGNNAMLAAETGCGKTLAFLLPLLDKLVKLKKIEGKRPPNHPLGLIITPSRELAHQIHDVASAICRDLMLETQLLIGGQTKSKMMNPTFEFMDLLVATVGALSKLTTSGIYNMSNVRHVVLDEADTLLDDSFRQYLTTFLRRIPFEGRDPVTNQGKSVQLTMSSATMPKEVPTSIQILVPSKQIQKIEGEKLHHVLGHVPQLFLRLSQSERPPKLLSLVKDCVHTQTPVMIFSNRSSTCNWASMFLNENGVKCINLSGEMPYPIRAGRFKQFQSGEFDVISCTDIASRGLDTTRVKHVINYDFPLYMADYIHRCGRTGRMGDDGKVTNLVAGHEEIQVVQQIETAVRKMSSLPYVSGNISRLITNKNIRNQI